MHSLWNFFLERRAFTILTMASLVMVGTAALVAMPKESTPEVILPIGIVSTVLPGATSADTERLVTDILEPAIRNIANIDKVTSSSKSGVSIITAQFVARADLETSLQDLRNAVESVKRDLPSDAEAPTITKIDFQDKPVLMIGVSTDLNPTALTKLAEDIKDEFLALPNVSKVEVSGVRDREVSVIVRTDALQAHNIRIEQVTQTLAQANASAPAGSLTIDDIEYPVQFKGDIAAVETILGMPIATPSGTVRLGDIATIVDGFEKPTTLSRFKKAEGEASYAMMVNVYKASGSNILNVSDTVRTRLDELHTDLLKGSDTIVIFDSAKDVRDSISELSRAGVETVLLVLLVLFIAIGFREAIVAALAIPFSFLIAFIGMWATGNSINFVSLFALIIAIGILVDIGIVVVEAIHTNREAGMGKIDAAKQAILQFSWPLIAGTMTTVAVFVPLFFLSGVLGQFVKSIPFTVIVVLLASVIVALGFVPIIALAVIKHSESALAKYRENMWKTIAHWYRSKMKVLLLSRKLHYIFYGFLTITFIIALALPMSGLLKAVMFPADDVDFVYIEIELPEASTLASTNTVTRVVEHIVAQNPFVESYITTIGETSAFNELGAGANAKYANITVNMTEGRTKDETSSIVATMLRQELAHVSDGTVRVKELDSGPPAGAPVMAKIWSDNSAALAEATEMLTGLMRKTAGARDVSSSLKNDGTEIRFAIDRDKANDYGLTAGSIANTIRTAVAGMEATKIRIDGDDIPVRVTLNLNADYVQPEDTNITTTDTIATIPIATARGTVPLGSFLITTAGRSSSVITHENGMRIGSVSAYLDENINALDVTNAFRAEAEKLSLPEGVRITYGGDDEEIKKTFTEMLIALGAGVALMFSILVLEFNAFRTTLRLLLAVPLSLTGVLIGLFLMGQPLSFTAFLGIIALAGVIINHGILLLDVIHQKQSEHGDDFDPKTLILDASESRIRPILLTTITTVVGMIPLTLVSAMWAPLAFTIAFGLIYGTLLTLVLIPLLSYNHLAKSARKAHA